LSSPPPVACTSRHVGVESNPIRHQRSRDDVGKRAYVNSHNGYDKEASGDTLRIEDPLAVAAIAAIHTGDVKSLVRLLTEHPGLARVRLGSDCDSMARTLLHVATDWPGHFPNGSETVAVLVAAGADVNARFQGSQHSETPLHWGASSNDVAVLDALLDAGADIDVRGGVIADGTPLSDARAFEQWEAAHRLVERGATTTIVDAATLGLLDRVQDFSTSSQPSKEEVDRAFWGACHGGQQQCAEYLLGRGADVNWIPPQEPLTPLDAAQRNGADELVRWLRDHGGTPAQQAAGP
jgi:uncharacterized protein